MSFIKSTVHARSDTKSTLYNLECCNREGLPSVSTSALEFTGTSASAVCHVVFMVGHRFIIYLNKNLSCGTSAFAIPVHTLIDTQNTEIS